MADLSVLKFPRFEHFDIEYSTGNSFSFLGNGFCTRELDGVSLRLFFQDFRTDKRVLQRDLTWYMGNLEGEDKEPPPFELRMEDGGGKFTAAKKAAEGQTNGVLH